ncbi:excisionase family DNA-binding protein [Nocardia sp. CC227C]|uniref:excisionase family DNA-binding protein n=1 Tax=Nocardia sp. CC227C TaxID=3044562 RepID=UPI00278C7AF6|nr:excisionase family DNA-binding protein [Nocardia sp. CC227C]
MAVCHVEADVSQAVRDELRNAVAELRGGAPVESTITIDEVAIRVPSAVREAVLVVLEHLSAGRGVVIGPVDALLTTSTAAELLGLSRTYVCRLVDSGELAAEYRGTHRRIPLQAVLDYREQRRRDRARALDDVAGISRTAALYDDDF